MKTIFKHALAVTAFVAASAANAQVFIDITNPLNYTSTESLTFSSDALGAVAAAGAFITTPTVVPTIAGLPDAGAANTATYTKANGSLIVSGQSLITLSGDAVTSVASTDSVIRLSRAAFDEGNNLVNTYSVYLTGLTINLAQASVSAEVYTTDSVSGTLTDHGLTTLFQATGATGGVFTYGANGPTASGALTGGLRLTTQATALLLSSLGLDPSNPSNPVTNLWSNANWGNVAFSAPATVPEPSSWALFGIGLLAVGAVARRRQA